SHPKSEATRDRHLKRLSLKCRFCNEATMHKCTMINPSASRSNTFNPFTRCLLS
ncbi:hypothetical protein IRJ41_011320, partial [Triplophysa rosa]